MPTYEYACRACGLHVEVVQSMADSPLDTCGACGGRLRKVFHPAGIMFKGSGFYATDNRAASAAKKLEGAGTDEIKSAGKKALGGGSASEGTRSPSESAPAKERSA